MATGILDNIEYIPCNPKNYGRPRNTSDIKYLVYHYTGNDGDTAKSNCIYYKNNVVEASAHYFVDDWGVKQSVMDLFSAWSVGGKKWNDCDKTGGGTLYGVVKNQNSISIEMCDTRKDGIVMATDETLANAIELGKWLMQKYNIPFDHVVRHFDVTGKYCPKYFMDNDKWMEFKSRLLDEEENPVKRYNTIEEINKDLPWATATITKLINKGLLNGTGEGLDLSEDMIRLLVINDRSGAYGV